MSSNDQVSTEETTGPQYKIETIGGLSNGCDGGDEYLLVTRTNGDIDLKDLKDYALEEYGRECSGPGQYYCNSVSAVMVEYSDNQAIITVHHRYDV